MEHSHGTFVHDGHVITIPREALPSLLAAVAAYQPVEWLRRLAAERLAQFHMLEVDCTEADPMWCAAVLYYYTGPLWACDF